MSVRRQVVVSKREHKKVVSESLALVQYLHTLRTRGAFANMHMILLLIAKLKIGNTN